jgi:hypothetical protein
MELTFTELESRAADAARLIGAEFDEMPGMRLTAAQVKRLWNLSEGECQQALDYLCVVGVLTRDAVGRYLRRDFDY